MDFVDYQMIHSAIQSKQGIRGIKNYPGDRPTYQRTLYPLFSIEKMEMHSISIIVIEEEGD